MNTLLSTLQVGVLDDAGRGKVDSAGHRLFLTPIHSISENDGNCGDDGDGGDKIVMVMVMMAMPVVMIMV